MAFEKLQDAVDQLQRFIEMPRVADVAATVLSPSVQGQAQVTVATELMGLLLNVSRGSKTSRAMTEKLKELSTSGSNLSDQDLLGKIKIFVDGNANSSADTMSKIVGKGSAGLSAIQVDSIRITPAGRLVNATAMFLNMVPTLEISRCVPYLTVEVQTRRSPISGDNKVQGLSLGRFLQGAEDVSAGASKLLLALQTDQDGNRVEGATISGMELFTSPQTLVDPSPDIDSRRSAPALDKFRPFMSIDKLLVEVQPQVGFFSYRTATLELTLHDRSRLNEIADFVKPDLYGSTELMLEYGWSHPDRSDQNVYATLINSMRVREKYGIVNSAFSFTKTGEAKIKLRLYTKGFTDTQRITIGDSADEVKAAREALQDLQRVITEVRIRVLQEDTTRSNKEIRGEQQLFAQAEDLGATLELPPEAAQAVKKFLRRNDKNLTGDMRTLRDSLLELYGPDGKGGKGVKTLKTKVGENVQRKLTFLKKPAVGSDPFLSSGLGQLASIATATGLKDLKISSSGFVSFGRLMSIFIGQPLAQHGYDDVQLIFYPFNAKAGAAAALNVAEFPIKMSELTTGLQAIGTQQGLTIPIKDFVQYIANNFIDDMANHAYGLSNAYRSSIDAQTGVRQPPQGRNAGADDTRLFDAVQARLQKLNVQDGVFKMPQLDVIIETVPVDVTAVGQSAKTESTKSVLKIHFFDRCATAYESLGQLILASRENTINALGNGPGKDEKDHLKVYKHYLNLASQAGIITPVQTSDVKGVQVFDVKFDYEKLKTFIRQNIPSIVYGSNATGVEEASFATIQEPRLSTIHMRRAGEQGALSPVGLTRANLPLRTLPAQVSLTTLGCPTIHYMQQFFVDFSTNTTVDNIYGVNKLSHELSSGKFFSRMELIPLDAYGRYESVATQVAVAITKLSQAIDSDSNRNR